VGSSAAAVEPRAVSVVLGHRRSADIRIDDDDPLVALALDESFEC
jgi:hypothetical protein